MHAQFSVVLILLAMAAMAMLMTPDAARAATSNEASTALPAARVLESSGRVERILPGGTTWEPAAVGTDIPEGSRLRTGAASRATLQFSDRSILRLGPSSLVAIQPPRQSTARRRFLLDLGRLFFLDREAPLDIEFQTPVATGAIRGTEFLLTASEGGDVMSLALLDGAVELTQDETRLAVSAGELAELRRGQAPVVSRIVLAQNLVQWCLPHPAVLVPADLALTAAERVAWAPSLDAWNSGAIARALEVIPAERTPATPDATAYHAALLFAAGEVETADRMLSADAADTPAHRALQELLAAVRFEEKRDLSVPATPSEWLARSYYLQSRSDLPAARLAARQAAGLAPDFGAAWIRIAELELSFADWRAADAALAQGLSRSPRSAAGHALQGFAHLAARRTVRAEEALEQARHLDAGLGNAWLGLALLSGQRGDADAARRHLQVAAALEPTRAKLRSNLGKAWAEARDSDRAAEELQLASRLDPADPTPWLYQALEQFQNLRPNDAITSLERSIDLNDRRSVFRSRLLLDQDRATRNADLAAIFQSVGLDTAATALAARSLEDDPANSAAHLFLARSLQRSEDPRRTHLRWEPARQSELLRANLLAPPGAGNLSQQLAQQDHLRYLSLPPAALATFSEFQGDGDWRHLASAFGTVGGLAYALDAQYLRLRGDAPSTDLERRHVSFQAKQRLSAADELYLQLGLSHSDAGDGFSHLDPADADPDLAVREFQEPHLYLGWHRQWSPSHHTLLLASSLSDRLRLEDARRRVPFLRESGGAITAIDLDRAVFDLRQESEFALRGLDLQHLWNTENHGVTAGARYQSGSLDSNAALRGPLPPAFADQSMESAIERVDAYADYTWRPLPDLALSGGAGFHHLRLPLNVDLPPFTGGTTERNLWAPRFGAVWNPLPRTQLRAAYAQSLSGLSFDDSIRLEPTQVAGFVTALRSLTPESVAGLLPALRVETTALGVDHSFKQGIYVGASVESRRATASREVGAAGNSLPLPLPDRPISISQSIDARETRFSAYAAWLIQRDWSIGLRYQVTDASFGTRFPSLPSIATGLDDLEQDLEAIEHRLRGSLRWQHPFGWFAEWHSEFRTQDATEAGTTIADESLWQHDLFGGYRFPRRRAEVRLGILNLTDADYRLHPLTLDEPPARERTFTASLRLNF